MQLNVTLNKIGFLLLVWAFFVALAVLGANIPTALLVIGTILYLFG